MRDYVYTIGREFGSDGKNVGFALAEKLGIKCYDKELLDRAAKESGICQELFEHHDERPTNSFLYSLVMDTYSMSGYTSAPFVDMPLNHKVFLAQFEAIKKIASEGPCVLVGRCADYALSDNPNCINAFVHADLDYRIENMKKRFGMNEKQAKDTLAKKDKQRASYYNYYTNKKWGDAESYDICINSSKFGVDGCVKAIKDFLELEASLEE